MYVQKTEFSKSIGLRSHVVRNSIPSSTVSFLSTNIGHKSCRKRLLWTHVRLAGPGKRNKDEYSGGAPADIDLPRIAPRRRGDGGQPADAAAIPVSVYGYCSICMYCVLRLYSIVMNTYVHPDRRSTYTRRHCPRVQRGNTYLSTTLIQPQPNMVNTRPRR